MSSPCDPKYAPVGDVGAALMMVDARLKAVHGGASTGDDPEQRALTDQFIASLGPGDARDVLDGACTLIFVFMKWLREAYEDHGKDPVEHVVPSLVATMRQMPKSIRPEAVPTMAGLLVAAAMDLSPDLWRRQYGDWTEAEMNPLEATTFLLADHINRLTDDPDFAVRMVAQALTGAEHEPDQG